MERLKMTIAKHSKDLNLQPSPKKPFPYWIKKALNLIPTILLTSLVGTYLDLYFVGRGLYSFPMRPFPEIFSINITFTLLGLPLLTSFFLLVCQKVSLWKKVGLVLVLSLLMSIAEKKAEAWGLFIHHESWKHIYSFIGYIFYLTVIYSFYHGLKKGRDDAF